MKIVYDTEVCGRCGGSGKYSYNTMHGDRCFKCGGNGKQLTKAAKKAKKIAEAWKKEHLTIRAGDITVGMVLMLPKTMLGPNRPCTVTAVVPSRTGRWDKEANAYLYDGIEIQYGTTSGYNLWPDSTLQRAMTTADIQQIAALLPNTGVRVEE